jgi:hypothetical protein
MCAQSEREVYWLSAFFVFAGTLDAWSRKKPAPGCWWKLDKTTDAVTRGEDG